MKWGSGPNLARRLTATMLSVAVTAVVLSGLLVNWAVSRQFGSYIQANHSARVARVVSAAESLYAQYGNWPEAVSGLEAAGPIAGARFAILNNQGVAVYDSAPTDAPGRERGQGHRSTKAGSGAHDELPIMSQGRRVGTVRFIERGPGANLLAQQDADFRRTVNWSIIATVLATILGAVVASWRLAKGLAKPLTAITDAAKSLGRGDLSHRVPLKAPRDGPAKADEITTLAVAFNGMADQLESMDYLRRKQAANISHELRTPLTILQGHVEAVQDGVMPCSPATFEAIHDEVTRLSSMVADLQELTLIESGRANLQLVEVDLADLVTEEGTNLQSLFASRGLALRIETPATTPRLRALTDPDAVSKVLRNLLMNALKYTDAGGTVTLTASLRLDMAAVAIADTGIGIAADELPYIFERFYRADASRSRGTGGAGIGLSIARELTEKLGGKLDVESTVGVGTIFTLSIPTAKYSDELPLRAGIDAPEVEPHT